MSSQTLKNSGGFYPRHKRFYPTRAMIPNTIKAIPARDPISVKTNHLKVAAFEKPKPSGVLTILMIPKTNEAKSAIAPNDISIMPIMNKSPSINRS